MEFKLVDSIQPDFDPKIYVVDEGLRQAAEVAFALRQPLLLMGEPGTGKTRFAQKLAYELSLKKEKFQLMQELLRSLVMKMLNFLSKLNLSIQIKKMRF